MPEEEKTHPATPRRKRRSRERGQIAKSREINSALVLIGGVCLLKFLGYPLFTGLFHLSQSTWSELFYFTTSQGICARLKQAILHTAFYLLPFFLFIAVIAALANIIQTGFIFTLHPLRPNLNRINPAEGLRRIFSLQSLVRLLISFLKVIIIGIIGYWAIEGQLPFILSLTGQEVGKIFIQATKFTFRLPLFLCLGIVPLAILDYIFQRRRHEKQLRMSREEFREELKQTEGDPLVKERIRSIQRQMSRSRMMQEIPRADVVITNPQHIAVALRYEREKMNAPVLVARGAGLIAEKIKELAGEHRIPIVENKWLARVLYKSVEVGEEIPVKFYQAVAEVLAHVYSLKRRRMN